MLSSLAPNETPDNVVAGTMPDAEIRGDGNGAALPDWHKELSGRMNGEGTRTGRWSADEDRDPTDAEMSRVITISEPGSMLVDTLSTGPIYLGDKLTEVQIAEITADDETRDRFYVLNCSTVMGGTTVADYFADGNRYTYTGSPAVRLPTEAPLQDVAEALAAATTPAAFKEAVTEAVAKAYELPAETLRPTGAAPELAAPYGTPITEPYGTPITEAPLQQAAEFTDPEAAEFTPAPTGRVDNNGVEFDANFCGEAAVPFYASGKTAGQWKRKRGLSEIDYNTWYAARVADLPVAETAAAPTSTASAFAPASATPPPVEAAQPQTLSTAGELMAWVAEMQVAGHLTQGAVDAAYVAAGLSLPDMFPPKSPELIANNVGRVFAALSAQVPA
jgi:hypothetical protein